VAGSADGSKSHHVSDQDSGYKLVGCPLFGGDLMRVDRTRSVRGSQGQPRGGVPSSTV